MLPTVEELLRGRCSVANCRKVITSVVWRRHPETKLHCCAGCYSYFKRHNHDKFYPKRDCPVLFGLINDDEDDAPIVKKIKEENSSMPYTITVSRLPDVSTLLKPIAPQETKDSEKLKKQKYGTPMSQGHRTQSNPILRTLLTQDSMPKLQVPQAQLESKMEQLEIATNGNVQPYPGQYSPEDYGNQNWNWNHWGHYPSNKGLREYSNGYSNWNPETYQHLYQEQYHMDLQYPHVQSMTRGPPPKGPPTERPPTMEHWQSCPPCRLAHRPMAIRRSTEEAQPPQPARQDQGPVPSTVGPFGFPGPLSPAHQTSEAPRAPQHPPTDAQQKKESVRRTMARCPILTGLLTDCDDEEDKKKKKEPRTTQTNEKTPSRKRRRCRPDFTVRSIPMPVPGTLLPQDQRLEPNQTEKFKNPDPRFSYSNPHYYPQNGYSGGPICNGLHGWHEYSMDPSWNPVHAGFGSQAHVYSDPPMEVFDL